MTTGVAGATGCSLPGSRISHLGYTPIPKGISLPLYIRDDEVAALARQVQVASGCKTVTDAVRLALHHEIERLRDSLPPSRRLGKALAIADAIEPPDADR